MTSRERVKDERREQILHHALRLFVRKGLAATRMADIAAAAGVSQGLAYHYYPSKEEIFVELIRAAYARMTEAAVGLEKLEMSPRDKIVMAAEQLIQGFSEGESATLNFLLIIQASVFEAIPQEARELVQGRALLHEVIARIVAEGQREGSFKGHDPKDVALTFWSALAGLAIYKVTLGDNFKAPDPRVVLGMFIDV